VGFRLPTLYRRAEPECQLRKEELGLDRFNGRSWRGPRHAAVVVLADGFLLPGRGTRKAKIKGGPMAVPAHARAAFGVADDAVAVRNLLDQVEDELDLSPVSSGRRCPTTPTTRRAMSDRPQSFAPAAGRPGPLGRTDPAVAVRHIPEPALSFRGGGQIGRTRSHNRSASSSSAALVDMADLLSADILDHARRLRYPGL
jgi:hypothetical protein